MVFGIRCSKEIMYITVLEGSIDNFSFVNEDKRPIKIIIPKSYDTREEQLEFIYKEIIQVIEKYNPTKIGLKGHENSPHKVNPVTNAQRGEIEGLVRLVSSQKGILVQSFLYSQTKNIINVDKASKKVQLDLVRKLSGCTIKDDLCIDSILMALVVL